MTETMDDVDETVEQDEVVEDDLDDAEPSEADLADAVVPPDPATGGDVESIQELLVKQEAAEEDEAEEDEPVVPLTREEKLAGPLEGRGVPIQSTEFTCKRCFLVKHRSQLKDKKKMLCRDCA